jgi:hypothetical protein
MSDQRFLCECCGDRAAVQDRDGVWLCEDDFIHLHEHARLEDTEDTDE